MCSALNRFRNEYRTRYCKTESAQHNPSAQGVDCSPSNILKDFFVDRIEADMSTVDLQPLICSTPINVHSRTAQLHQNKQELVPSTDLARFVRILSKESLSKSSERIVQTICRPESGQAYNILRKDDFVPDSPGCGAKKVNNFLERETEKHIIMMESDDEDVEADKGEAILLEAEAEMADVLLEHNHVERPHDKQYGCDTSVELEPLSPTVKLQARKRLSFKDKESPFGSKRPTSELSKHSQPEDKIMQRPRVFKIPVPSEKSRISVPSVHTASEKDTELGIYRHSKETQHTLTNLTTEKVEKLAETQSGTESRQPIRTNEKCGNPSQPLNEKSTNRFASMLFKTMHPENRLSKDVLHPPRLPCPLTIEYNLEEEFEIEEASSFIFKSWDREFKNVKPSTKQPTTAAAGRKKCVTQEQKDTKSSDLRVVDTTAINLPLCSSRKKTATETDQVRALANVKELSTLQQKTTNNIVMVKDQPSRQTVVQNCETDDIRSSAVIATDAQTSNKTVLKKENLPTEVEDCESAPVLTNHALLKEKTRESQVKSKTLSTLAKKTKKGYGVCALKPELTEMQNIENSTCITDRLSLAQTHTNENYSPHMSLPKNVLAKTVPAKVQQNVPQKLLNQADGQMPSRKMLKKIRSVNSVSETANDQMPPVENAAGHELSSNLPFNDRGKIKEKQQSKNQAAGDEEKGVLDTKRVPSPLSDDSEKLTVLELYPSQKEATPPPAVSKRGRRVKTGLACAVADLDQDLLTLPAKGKKKVSMKLKERVSKKKQQSKSQAAGDVEKGVLDTKRVPSPLSDDSEKLTVLELYPSQKEATPPLACAAADLDQDLLTLPANRKKKVSRKLKERVSKKKQGNKNQAAGCPEKDLETKHPPSSLHDNSDKSPVPDPHLSPNEENAPPSVSKRGRILKTTSAWWAVNPEQDILTFPAKAKKKVSRKLTDRFSKRGTSNKKNKVVRKGKKISLRQVKIDDVTKPDSPADLDVKDQLVETNTAKENTNEQSGYFSDNTERHFDSECQGKKRKIDDVSEDNEMKQQPLKKKKSILKSTSKYKCPTVEERTERHLEEESENPKTKDGVALPLKMESRVSALRRSLLPPIQTSRLSTFQGSLQSFGAAYSKTPDATKRTPELDSKKVTPRLSPTKSLGQRYISPDRTVIGNKSRMPVYNSSECNSVSEKEADCQIENMDRVLDVAKLSEENLEHNTHEKRVKRTRMKKHSKEDAEDVEEDPKLDTHIKKVTGVHKRRHISGAGPVLEQDDDPCKHSKPANWSLRNKRCLEVSDVLQQKVDGKEAKVSRQKERFLESAHVLQEDLELNTQVKNIKRSYCKGVPEQIEHSNPNNRNLEHVYSSSCSENNVEDGTLRKMTHSISDHNDNSSSGTEDGDMTENLGRLSGQCDKILEKKKLGTFDKNDTVVTPRKEYFIRFPGTSKEKTGLNFASKVAHPASPSILSKTFELPNEKVLLTPVASALGCSNCIQSGSGPVPCRNVRIISHKDTPIQFDLCQSDPDSTDSETDTNCTFVIQTAAEKKNKIVLPSHTPNLRRSKRTRVRALEFWRGERIAYKLRPSGFVVDGILSPEQNENIYHRDKAKTKGHVQNPRQDYVLIPAEKPVTRIGPITVMDPVEGKETYLDCVKTQDQCVFFCAEGLPAVCKSFTQPRFSMGEIILAPFQEKGFSFVHRGTLLFYIMDGKVLVTLHCSQYQLENGDSFFVPPGNMYNIQNLREESNSIILFVHVKEQKKTEVEDIG